MRRMAGLWAALLLVLALTPVQAGAVELPIQAEAALLMEKETGQVLYAQMSTRRWSRPASPR